MLSYAMKPEEALTPQGPVGDQTFGIARAPPMNYESAGICNIVRKLPVERNMQALWWFCIIICACCFLMRLESPPAARYLWMSFDKGKKANVE